MSSLCAADTPRRVRVLLLAMYSSTLEFLNTSADGQYAETRHDFKHTFIFFLLMVS